MTTAPALLTIADCLAQIPPGFRVAERRFRRAVRASGCYMANGHQLLLTPADFQAVMDTLRPCSNSLAGPIVRSGKSSARSAASEYAKARARIADLTPKRSSASGSRKS